MFEYIFDMFIIKYEFEILQRQNGEFQPVVQHGRKVQRRTGIRLLWPRSNRAFICHVGYWIAVHFVLLHES